jgi:hypothetical protein
MSGRHDPSQNRLIWPPEPGLFRLRLVKGAWGVPARIHHWPAANLWAAEIDEALSDSTRDPAHIPQISMIWHGGLRIDAAEYEWLIETKRYAEIANPEHPCLSPTRPIDRSRLRPFVPAVSQQRTIP